MKQDLLNDAFVRVHGTKSLCLVAQTSAKVFGFRLQQYSNSVSLHRCLKVARIHIKLDPLKATASTAESTGYEV